MGGQPWGEERHGQGDVDGVVPVVGAVVDGARCSLLRGWFGLVPIGAVRMDLRKGGEERWIVGGGRREGGGEGVH